MNKVCVLLPIVLCVGCISINSALCGSHLFHDYRDQRCFAHVLQQDGAASSVILFMLSLLNIAWGIFTFVGAQEYPHIKTQIHAHARAHTQTQMHAQTHSRGIIDTREWQPCLIVTAA
jgi:hypothetical protein